MKVKIDKKDLKVIVVCILVIVVSLLYGGSLLYKSSAYFQDKDFETNYHSVGSNESVLVKSATKPAKYANTTFNYTCKVTNTGSVPCYVRVMLVPAYAPEKYTYNTVSCDSNINSSAKWYHVPGEDNYYYYKTPLQPGESTPNLLSSISLNRDLTGHKADYCKIFCLEETKQSEGYSNCLNAFQ